MANSKDVSNGKIYELVQKVENRQSDKLDSMRVELKGDIIRLEGKFDTLEAGRLTRAEGNIADLRNDIQKIVNDFNKQIGSMSLTESKISGKVALFWALGGAIIIAVLTAVAYRVIVGASTH